MLRLFIFILFLFSGISTVYSQSVEEAAIRAEIEKRGYDAERFKAEMIKKGVNSEAINPDNPADVARAKKAAEEVMAMLEAEKKSKSNASQPTQTATTASQTEPQSKVDKTRSVDEDSKISVQSKDIQKAVKDGATIEEAVAEKLQEDAKSKLPPAQTYGQHIFRDKSLQLFRTSEDAKPTKSYVLGPGDKVAISIWGPTQENFALEIQKDGYIQPTGLPRYFIAGLTVDAAEKLMASRLKNYYYFQTENFELAVTTARTLNVNIVGEVFTNGTFNISAVNTAFNALVAAGGPNDLGSVRKIQLLRAGKKPVILDVYKFLQNPVLSQDYYLAENDFINVPVAENLVVIKGAINRPFQYELLKSEGLEELIQYAGGLKATALQSNIQVKRIEYDSIRIIDVNWADLLSAKQNFSLKNGDEVEIFEINNQIKNEVSISGAIENPGVYAMKGNDRLSDLIKKAKLKDNAITDIAYLKRYNDDFKTIRYELINLSIILSNPNAKENLLLKKGDELIISSKATFADSYKMSVQGAVRNPTELVLDMEKNLRVSDAIFFAGGLNEDAISDFAYIFRSKIQDAKTIEYIPINFKEILANPSSASNIALVPGDRLVVYSKNNYTDESFIRVAGAVRQPGDFLYNPSLSLKDALILAGGLKREASKERVDVYRLEFDDNNATRVLAANIAVDDNYNITRGGNEFELQPFDQIIVRTAPEFELQRNVFVEGEVTYPGVYALMGDNTKLASLVREAGGTTKEAFLKGATLLRGKENLGYVIIDLEKALKNPKSFENIILQEGDVLNIPKINNVITITGATRSFELYQAKIVERGKVQVPYQKGKSAKYYIDHYAGGLAKEADPHKISVVDASGKVTKAKKFLFFRSYPKVSPGSEIRIGYKDVKEEKLKSENKEEVKWGDILANSIAQATAILSLILLIQNVN